ncbi:replication initiator protein [Microviridae sp.]|nr:replication initiator protein [Microviridae sp.]
MRCLKPISATQDAEGMVTLRRNRLDATLEDGEYLELACGRCGACRSNRARSWAIRCYHELQTNTRTVNGCKIPVGVFVTLTYDDEHLPKNGSLNVEDWQRFAKRVRNHLGPFRFLQCGEYGSLGRPHHHACLFGVDFSADRQTLETNGDQVTWKSDQLHNLWGKGFTMMAPLNFATASYTAGYVVKKAKTAEWEEQTSYIGDNLEVITPKQEFITMSRNPGLGRDWFEKYWRDVYPLDQVRIGGKEYSPPKYYDNLLFEMDPALHKEVIDKRIQHNRSLGPTSDNERTARGEIFAAKLAMKKPRR